MTRGKRDGSGQKRHSNEWRATHLHITLGDIQRGDSCVGGTASQNATEQALGVVRGVMRHWAEIPCQQAEHGQSNMTQHQNESTNLASHFLVGAKCAIASVVYAEDGTGEVEVRGWQLRFRCQSKKEGL